MPTKIDLLNKAIERYLLKAAELQNKLTLTKEILEALNLALYEEYKKQDAKKEADNE